MPGDLAARFTAAFRTQHRARRSSTATAAGMHSMSRR